MSRMFHTVATSVVLLLAVLSLSSIWTWSTKDVRHSDPQAPQSTNGLPNGGVGIGIDLSGTYG